MNKLKDQLIMLMNEFTETESKKLEIQQLLNLIIKLEDQKLDDEKMAVKLEELISMLTSIKDGKDGLKKNYKKSYYKLKQSIQTSFGIVEKGTYRKMGLTYGMTFGIIAGAAFTSGSVSISLGMVFGMVIGIAIGSIKDNKSQNEGKIY